MLRNLSYLLLFVLVSSCNNSPNDSLTTYIPEAPDYKDSALWYNDEKGDSIDVFYITPTCIFDWQEKNSGLPCHYYDVYGEVMKENFDYSLKLANEIFGEECNFYAPYYRQISLDSWTKDEDLIEERFTTAMNDIDRAFEYYMKNYNKGKKFVIAGYSQGAKAVVELVKELDKSTLSKMKAAYVIGYRVTDKDMQNSNIKAATGEKDKGVVICYSSVRGAEDIWNAVSRDNKVCINPVNWHTDGTPARLNDSITVTTDTINKVLLVSGYDGGGADIPLLHGVITDGNYHLSELTLFKDCLKENIRQRVR